MRSALAELPDGTSHGEAPSLRDVYFPQSHLKALHPDVLVVTGMRGAGKTFWWSALQNEAVRQLMDQRYARAKLSGNTVLGTGFGVRPAADEYPGKDVLKRLLQEGTEPRLIWRAVQAWQVARQDDPLRCRDDWASRTAYVREHPEMIDRLFEKEDAKLNEEGRHFVVLYDALDRAADEWRAMYRIIRGLLQTALDMRSYRRIRMKIFLRTDQFDKAEIGDFPDASKVLSSTVEMGWPRHELYGLLWHRLGNAESFSKSVRAALHRSAFGNGNHTLGNGDNEWRRLMVDGHGFWRVPRSLVSDETIQRRTFHSITGGWMGKDRRRGFPYTWIPNHLGDTKGKVSPRSFIAALKSAAEDTKDQHVGHGYALHYDSIKRGVQRASEIRVDELKEDYPWVDQLLKSLHGMVTPCDFADIAERWAEQKALERLRFDVEFFGDVKLPPSHIEEGPDGVRRDLESLHVFLRMRDGRVNVPDVFRIGYGLGRRGGVRPVR